MNGFPHVEVVMYDELRPAGWRVTHTLKPDLRLVMDSLVQHGWLQPLVVRPDGLIIDGFHRWWLAHEYRPVERKFRGKVPVVRVDVDEIDAMLLHVQMNRGHGAVLPKNLSLLVKDILRSGKYEEDEVRKQLRMGVDEFGLLMDGTLLKHRKVAEYEYSKAWEPIEAAKGEAPDFERPPNADR